MDAHTAVNGSVAAAIGWFYLATNATRVITYIPQIVAVWRCTDGARAISLLTWGSWLCSHLTAIAYGVLVVHDMFFVAISTINLIGCSAVTLIAAQRRGLLGSRPGVDPPHGSHPDEPRVGTAGASAPAGQAGQAGAAAGRVARANSCGRAIDPECKAATRMHRSSRRRIAAQSDQTCGSRCKPAAPGRRSQRSPGWQPAPAGHADPRAIAMPQMREGIA